MQKVKIIVYSANDRKSNCCSYGTYVYPIAGMAGVEMDEIELRKHSVVGDRRLGILREVTDKNGETTMNVVHTKDKRHLLLYQPRFENPADPKESRIIVLTPHGSEYYAGEEGLRLELSALCSADVKLLKNGKNNNYSGAFSGISQESLDAVAHALAELPPEAEDNDAHPLAQSRFRMNALFTYHDLHIVKGLNHEAELVGKQLKFSESTATASVWEEAQRCAAINYIAKKGWVISTPNILKVLTDARKLGLGFYAGIDDQGKIRPGTAIYT